MKTDIIESAEKNVKKFVFTYPDAVFESVLYRYPDYATRTVICCSTMSGCPVGCRFCGAGDFFARNATGDEIVAQVAACIEETSTDPSVMDRLQIMFMSMGEPLLNKNAMIDGLRRLHNLYPQAALLISTIGPDINYSWVSELSMEIPAIGLQFSLHEPTDEARNKLIPFSGKLTIDEIAATGEMWFYNTGRKPFFNYCAAPHNTDNNDADRIAEQFSPEVWEATISVICERNEGLPARNAYQEQLARDFSEKLLARGFNVRVFDPAGQDDIGGGCGQLWFVQSWANNNPDLTRRSIGHGMEKIHAPRPLTPVA